jgi:hypothetical protein
VPELVGNIFDWNCIGEMANLRCRLLTKLSILAIRLAPGFLGA